MAARNRRANVRGLMADRAARSSTVIGSSRCSWSQLTVPANRLELSRAGIGASMNWACPPSRWGATTSWRASRVATSLPWSRRTTCRHRSMLAALPAEVRMSPSSTNSTPGSTVTRGYRRASSPHSVQCVVARRPSSSPAAASAKAPVHSDTIRLPRAWACRRILGQPGRDPGEGHGRQHDHGVRAADPLRPRSGQDPESAVGGHRPRREAADERAVPGHAGQRGPLVAEDVAGDPQLERGDTVTGDDRHDVGLARPGAP